MNRIDRPKSLTEFVTQVLRRLIVEGDLQLGEALSESKIAKRLDVSRTPVREAFARLEIEGLVYAEPQRRTRVFTLDPKDLDDICDVRCTLEKQALTLAITRHRAKLAAALAKTAKHMTEARRAGENGTYLQLDSQFHQLIFDHADNVFLNDAYQTVASKMAALRSRLASHPDHLEKGFAEHLRLVELIADGDQARALEVLDAHIARKDGSFWSLNAGLASRRRLGQRSREHLADNDPTEADDLTEFSSRISDDKSVDHITKTSTQDLDIVAVSDENILDEKNRGRPRRHADDAARKRAWAAGERAKKKAERLATGEKPKRGRPRKYATQAERQKAYEDRQRQS